VHPARCNRPTEDPGITAADRVGSGVHEARPVVATGDRQAKDVTPVVGDVTIAEVKAE
jgi:hypothetical protein